MSEPLERRRILQGLGAAALGAGVLSASPARAQAEHQVPWSAGTEAPKLNAPKNACDCHMHIYDSRFPIAPSATLKPADAKADDYRLLQKRIGTTRNVVVQPSTYGTDNSCTLDGMAKIGPTARGVAVVDTSVTDAELKRLHDLGVRGIRFNLVQAGATTVDMLEPLSKRVDDLGWHVQIHMLGDQIVGIADILNRLPSPIVFDHMGRIPKDAGAAHPAYAVIGRLIDKGRTWVKLSGAYMDTKVGPPTYADFDEARPGLRQGGAAAHGLGERLAAPDREGQAERRHPHRPPRRMGAGRGDAQPHPGGEPGAALRVRGRLRRRRGRGGCSRRRRLRDRESRTFGS